MRVIDYYHASYECRKEGLSYYVNSLPLYRQEKEWESLGVKLSRATSSNWLTPLIKLMRKKLTPESYMWVYSTYAGSQTPIRLFD
ncbi:IS66 family transposase [Clostridium tyrobutyricum]|uniref:IS66 family transposase n=1 Tax=Clostridium tyrobutyricum TaxID=1519 RepID=UPI003C6C1EAC